MKEKPSMLNKNIINPHFDHQRVVWKDEYSGLYEPVDYSEQFDHEWRLFLEKKVGFTQHAGVELEDDWIDDRIFDLTGVKGILHKPKWRPFQEKKDHNLGGRQLLDIKFSTDHFQGKRCLDVACGAGRWTRTLQALGANVKSIDVSEHGLQSVRRFNSDTERVDIFNIPDNQQLLNKFDFTLGWGIVMHTHDPRLAFENMAKTVKEGGEIYVMVYAPTLHNRVDILGHRLHYHRNLHTFEEKLAYAYSITDRPENAINYLDMLNTFYNWVVEEETIHNWFRSNGFIDVITLNAHEKYPVAYHVFGRKRQFEAPYYDDHGRKIPHTVNIDSQKIFTLSAPFQKENGFAWQANVNEFMSQADDMKNPYRSKLILLENGQPLWFSHTPHDDIRKQGGGLYSHWGNLLYFSTTDNSDPNTNGRHYQIIFAEE
jgi:2-polyprenyl-3-methyl-5-hydroxy-6-metoxy-1,4-benzoquinol methylase